MRACVCVRACLLACVWVGGCECTGAGVCLRACRLTNPARNAPPYCHLWHLWLFSIFRLSHKMLNFPKNFTEHNTFVLIFSTTCIWNISHFKKNSARYCYKCKKSSCKVPLYFFRILMKLEFSRQIFVKSSIIKFNQDSSSGSRVVPCGRTDIKKLIVAFRNFANGPNNHKGAVLSSGVIHNTVLRKRSIVA